MQFQYTHTPAIGDSTSTHTIPTVHTVDTLRTYIQTTCSHIVPVCTAVHTDPLYILENITPAFGTPFTSGKSSEELCASISVPVHTKKIKKNIFLGYIRTLATYFSLSGGIFFVLLLGTNFSAYSQVVYAYMDPQAYVRSGDDILSAMAQWDVHTGVDSTDIQTYIEEKEDLQTITQTLRDTAPDIVERSIYSMDTLRRSIMSSTGVTFDIAPIENHIIIPRMWKNIPLLDVDVDAGTKYHVLEDILMKELEKGIVRYPGTATPGGVGNSFIFGHSSNVPWVKSEYNDVFALLDTLVYGDEIIVYYDQHKYVYTVVDKTVVKPGDHTAIDARDVTKKELSLMTCWPVGTTLNRLIVFTQLKEEKSM